MSPTLTQAITEARREVSTVLRLVKMSAETRRCGALTHPPRYARLLWSRLCGERPAPEDDLNAAEDHVIRQIHDFYGWKAKDAVKRKGVCAGSLYRSAAYLSLPPLTRTGSKYGAQPKNVHIEHTVPVSILLKHLRRQVWSKRSPSALHDHLIDHSICTAVTEQEKAALSSYGVSNHDHPEFSVQTGSLGQFPFMRYLPARRLATFQVFNVITGQPVDFAKFTYRDHLATLVAASALILDSATPAQNLYRFDVLTRDR